MVSKLDLAVIGSLVAGCAFWVEQGHRVVIDAPTQSELAAAAAATAAACPDNDNVPYSLRCLDFLQGAATSGMRGQMNEAEGGTAAPHSPRQTEITPLVSAAACPESDNVPYSASCLAYLRGATAAGMRWRVTAPAMPAAVYAPTSAAAAMSGNEKRVRLEGVHASSVITPVAW